MMCQVVTFQIWSCVAYWCARLQDPWQPCQGSHKILTTLLSTRMVCVRSLGKFNENLTFFLSGHPCKMFMKIVHFIRASWHLGPCTEAVKISSYMQTFDLLLSCHKWVAAQDSTRVTRQLGQGRCHLHMFINPDHSGIVARLNVPWVDLRPWLLAFQDRLGKRAMLSPTCYV